MKLYKTKSGILLEYQQKFYRKTTDWDQLINRPFLHKQLLGELPYWESLEAQEGLLKEEILAPVGRQEVWAAGVTYLRSKTARMEESKHSGGDDFYDKVYEAERPELFFKSMPEKVVGPGAELYIRRDSSWSVPEPELCLFLSSHCSIEGYTIGNDMSSRSIEGENLLYLPQAKIYDKSAGLGPCLYVPADPLPADTPIEMHIRRNGSEVYKDATSISRIKRKFNELAEYLFRESSFPFGCFLMTGTGLVPPYDFTLQPGDEVEIRIGLIGTLVNTVSFRKEISPLPEKPEVLAGKK